MITKTLLPIVTFMSMLSFLGCNKPQEAKYPTDRLTTRDGKELTLTFFGHASLAIEADGEHIYVDPVSKYADYASLPKADLILITHSHYDHLDSAAIAALATPQTTIICDQTSGETLNGNVQIMKPGETLQPRPYLNIEAVPAYNITEGHLQFHPREREDCGYILTIGGSRIYIAGDSENTTEMKSLRDIDVAFLPVNQPYTMTVEQAVDAVNAIRPTIFYPYHYGEVEVTTDVNALAEALKGVTEVRIRPME